MRGLEECQACGLLVGELMQDVYLKPADSYGAARVALAELDHLFNVTGGHVKSADVRALAATLIVFLVDHQDGDIMGDEPEGALN